MRERGVSAPQSLTPNGECMVKQLVKIVNTGNNRTFEGSEILNPHLLRHAEDNPDTYEMVFMEIKETEEAGKPLTLSRLMGKSVKEIQKIASDNKISFPIPMSQMTKSEIASAIIESMKGK
jgi:hypothetical protein